MIVADDIADWFAGLVNGNASVISAIPGLFVAERANEFATAPYGVFSVEQSGEPQYTSGRYYTVRFTISANVYSDVSTNTTSTAIRTMQALLSGIMKRVPTTLSLRNANEAVLCVTPIEASAKFAPELRNSKDVVVSRFAWSVLCCGDTEVS